MSLKKWLDNARSVSLVQSVMPAALAVVLAIGKPGHHWCRHVSPGQVRAESRTLSFAHIQVSFLPRNLSLAQVLFQENVLGSTKSVCMGVLFCENVLVGTKCISLVISFYENVLSWAKIFLAPVFPRPRCSSTSDVRKNGWFTHDSMVFGRDVRKKRFIVHVTIVFRVRGKTLCITHRFSVV